MREADARSVRRGLSLIELLVVIAIIGLLMAIIVPAAQSARKRALDLQCQNNLRQIRMGLYQYVHIYKQVPPRADGLIGGWTIEALPFLEQKAMRDNVVSGIPIAKAPDFLMGPPRIMRCPMQDDDSKAGVMASSHYILIPGPKRKSFRIYDAPLNIRIPWASAPEMAKDPTNDGPHDGRFFNDNN